MHLGMSDINCFEWFGRTQAYVLYCFAPSVHSRFFLTVMQPSGSSTRKSARRASHKGVRICPAAFCNGQRCAAWDSPLWDIAVVRVPVVLPPRPAAPPEPLGKNKLKRPGTAQELRNPKAAAVQKGGVAKKLQDGIPDEPPPLPVGSLELQAAMQTLVARALQYDTWRAGANFYPLPQEQLPCTCLAAVRAGLDEVAQVLMT